MSYQIEYSADAEDHLRALTARQQSIVLDTVVRQLQQQPTVETRNRKFMRPNPLAPWELRIGNLRVYDRVVEASETPESESGDSTDHSDDSTDHELSGDGIVVVTAVGVKRRNRVFVGGEEFTGKEEPES